MAEHQRACALCRNRSSTMHMLPKNPELRMKWLQFIFGTMPQQDHSNLVICSAHFQGSQVSRIGRGTHAFQPVHTLTRHTLYFSRKKMYQGNAHRVAIRPALGRTVRFFKALSGVRRTRICPPFETPPAGHRSVVYYDGTPPPPPPPPGHRSVVYYDGTPPPPPVIGPWCITTTRSHPNS